MKDSSNDQNTNQLSKKPIEQDVVVPKPRKTFNASSIRQGLLNLTEQDCGIVSKSSNTMLNGNKFQEKKQELQDTEKRLQEGIKIAASDMQVEESDKELIKLQEIIRNLDTMTPNQAIEVIHMMQL